MSAEQTFSLLAPNHHHYLKIVRGGHLYYPTEKPFYANQRLNETKDLQEFRLKLF